MSDIHTELMDGLQRAAAGEFKPWFYRVKVSPRRWKRHRMPGVASRVSPAEARAIQAFHAFSPRRMGVTALARKFHRKRDTITAVLNDPVYQAYLEHRRSAT